MNDQALHVLRALNHGARLHGRLDSSVPFKLSIPGAASQNGDIPLAVAEALHNEGWIEIDESAPIAEIYTFQISAAGKEHIASQ